MHFNQNSLGWLFSVVVRMHHNCLHTMFKERGLAEINHPRLLFVLGHAEKHNHQLAQRDLAASLGISPASIAVSLKRMEKSGLIQRSVHNDDNRRNDIMLTERGRALVKLCQSTAYDLEEQLFAGFNQEEQALLYNYFERIITNMEALGVTAPRPLTDGDLDNPCPGEWPG